MYSSPVIGRVAKFFVRLASQSAAGLTCGAPESAGSTPVGGISVVVMAKPLRSFGVRAEDESG